MLNGPEVSTPPGRYLGLVLVCNRRLIVGSDWDGLNLLCYSVPHLSHSREIGGNCPRQSCPKIFSPLAKTSIMPWPLGVMEMATSGPKARKNSFAIHVAVLWCCQGTQ